MILLPVVFLLDFQEWGQIGERASGNGQSAYPGVPKAAPAKPSTIATGLQGGHGHPVRVFK